MICVLSQRIHKIAIEIEYNKLNITLNITNFENKFRFFYINERLMRNAWKSRSIIWNYCDDHVNSWLRCIFEISCHIPMQMIALNRLVTWHSKYDTGCAYETAELLKNIRAHVQKVNTFMTTRHRSLSLSTHICCTLDHKFCVIKNQLCNLS